MPRKLKIISYKVCPTVGLAVSVAVLMLSLATVVVAPTFSFDSVSATDAADSDSGSGVAVQLASDPSLAVALGSNVALSMKTSARPTFASGSTTLNVRTANSKDYVVSLATVDGSSALHHNTVGIDAEIAAVATPSTPNDFAANTWGYSFSQDEASDTTVYSAIPTQTTVVKTVDTYATGVANDTYNLTFGVAADNSIPAGAYSNLIMVSVVANPYRSFNEVTYMQEMTADLCASIRMEDTARLLDRRDNKSYWVAKLADGHCWMTQNLDLDLSTATTLTPNDTNITSDWTPSISTEKITTSSSKPTANTSSTGLYSWDYGMKVLKNPTKYASDNTSRCSGVDNLESCTYTQDVTTGYTDDFEATGTGTNIVAVSGMQYDAHYLLGNYYQWNTATAGTGGSMTSGTASGSICPKGWHIPDGNSIVDGSFGYLIATKYGIANSAAGGQTLVSKPLYFVWAGGIFNGSTRYVGSDGDYWSRTPLSNASNAASLGSGADGVNPSNFGARNLGFPIRCML